MKKMISLILCLCLFVTCLPLSASAATSYNASKALNYAKAHWNDGKELCAGFVSNCIKAGGLSSWNRECTNLYNQLNNEVVKGSKIASIQYLTPSGNYIKTADNKGKVSKGDILFWLCQGCPTDSVGGPYQHTALVSDVSGTYVNVYQHNGAQNNTPAYVGNCYECGRRYSHMVVIRFGSSFLPTNLQAKFNKSSYALGDTVTITPTAAGATLYNVTIWDGGAYNKGSCVFEKWNFTGSVSYKPQKTGTYCIRMDAKNDAGRISIEKTFTVSEAKTPCSITFPVSSLALDIGASKTITFDFKGTGVSSMWFDLANTNYVSASWGSINHQTGKASLTITARIPGYVPITVALVDSQKNVLCRAVLPVTVNHVPCSISVPSFVSQLNIGESRTLSIGYTGTAARTLHHKSSSGAVEVSLVNITGNGLGGAINLKLIGKSAGTSTVTLSFHDENDKEIYSRSFSVTVNPLRVSSVSLSKSSLSLTVGQSELLTASVSPSNATNRAVIWSSNNSSVASVSGGVVTARNPGTAAVTATVDGKSTSCQVTVKGIEVSHVTIDRASAELRIGDTIQLNASVYPSNATDRSVSWSSNNSAIAAVSSTGLVTAKSEGLVRVWARAGGKEEYCSILVVPREVEGLTLSASELELSLGETHMLEASVYPEDAGNSTITWSSSAPEIVRVENGWLTALKPGKAVITAAAGNFSKTCTVTVSEAEVESLRISESFLEIAPGETKSLSVEILPESSANRSISWSSSDREIAVVENGQITGVSPGFVKITATCGRLETACYVRVLGEDDGLLDPTEENEFIDVPNGAYFSAAVDWAVEKGITAGTDRSHFSPNQVCTRAQAVTFLWRAAGSPKPLYTETRFTDISEKEYYYDAVIWAAERGITGGVSKNRFAPNDKCTRAQIVCFMHRMVGMPEVSSVSPFQDVPYSMYYADSVAWAVENGITAGTSATTFSPHNDCSRGQIVTFLYRFLG